MFILINKGMKTFKEFLFESAPPIGFGDDPNPPIWTPDNGLSTGANVITGLRPENLPFINYRSASMTPGAEQDDGYVAGGGGFKIEKESKSFLMNLAKKYGINMPDPQQQQGGAPGGGGNPMQAMMGQMGQHGQGQPQQQQGPPGMGGGQPPAPEDRLMKNLSVNPMMLDLMGGEMGEKFKKIFGEMQKWKMDAKDPKIIQKSQQAQNPYEIWMEKEKETDKKNKENIGRQGTILGARMFATNVFNTLNQMGMQPEDNPHIRNYLDPYNHDEELQQQYMQQQPQEDEEDDQNVSDDSETNVDYGYD